MKSDLIRGATEPPSPQMIREMYQLMCGYRVSQAISVVAQLGIAGRLATGAMESDELARDSA